MRTRTIRNAPYLGAILVAGAAVVLVAGAAVVAFATWRPSVQPPPAVSASPSVDMPLTDAGPSAPASPVTALEQPPPPPAELRPVFDIVRVDASGDAVVAGHAAADVVINLRLDGRIVGSARSNGAGQFVILVSAFSPGGHQLELATSSSDGQGALSSEAVAINVLSDKKTGSVSSPATPSGVNSAPPTNPPSPPSPTAPSVDAGANDARTTQVVGGDSLWSISTHLLGSGQHYPEIHAANSAQIRNPQLIYPGQVLLVPPNAPSP